LGEEPGAMTAESANIRALREIYGRENVEQAAELMHPAVEMRMAAEMPDADDYAGRGELIRGTNRWLEEWQGFRFLVESLRDLTEEQVLVQVRLTGSSRTSRIPLEQVVFHLWTFLEGLPWRCEVFLDEQAATEGARSRQP
jgi:hypothetical protein